MTSAAKAGTLDQAATGGPPPLPVPFSTVRRSAAVSLLGDGLAVGALPLLAHDLTSSAFLIALAAAMTRIPSVAGLWLGQLADRNDPRRIMVLCDIVRGVMLGAFGFDLLFHRPPIAVLYLTAFALGTFSTLYNAAANMTIASLVPTLQLTKAHGQLMGLSGSLEQFVGPPVGAWLYSASRWVPFFGDSLSFFGSAVFLSRLAPMPPAPRPKRRVWVEVKEGARFVARNPVLRSATMFIAVAAFCQQSVFAIQVIYFKDLLGLSDAGFGLLLGFTAIGNVIGNLVSERVVRRFGPATALLASALTAAASYATLALHLGTGLVAVVFIVEAVAIGVGNVANIAIRQAATPAELRGRVGAFARTFVVGGAAIGSIVGGLLASHYGVRSTCAVAGIFAIAGGIALGPALHKAVSAAKLRIA